VLQVGRRTSKDTKLGEYSLPAGVVLTFQLLSIHRDKELWGEDAEQFKPDRFSEWISRRPEGITHFFLWLGTKNMQRREIFHD